MDPDLRRHIDRRTTAIDTIRRILTDNLHVQARRDAIDPDAPMFGTGLALDSVDALELVVASEASFGVVLPQEELRQSLRTVNTLVDLVLDLQDAGGAR